MSEPPEPTRLTRFGHLLVALGMVYGALLLFGGLGGAGSNAELAGKVAVPVSCLGIGGLCMLLGQRRA